MAKRYFIRLTKDIANPEADRRFKRDWQKQEVIPAGLRLLFTDYENGNRIIEGPGVHNFIEAPEPLAKLILNASERVEPENSAEAIQVAVGKGLGGAGVGILDLLLRDGRITTDEIGQLATRWNEED